MKCYTWCNIVDHPKLAVLEKSAKAFNIHINVLGKGIKWERNFLKIGLLLEAIKDLDADELIMCTDAFDVLYLQGSQTIIERYHMLCKNNTINKSTSNNPVDLPLENKMLTELETSRQIVFSAERLYSHHYPKYKAFWDSIPAPYGYRYLNSGTFIGYQKELVTMLRQILKDAHNYTEKSDQKLYAEYAVKNPGKIILDYRCELFWCPAGEQEILGDIYKIESVDKHKQLKNLKTNQNPCLIHITHSKGFYDLLLKVALQMEFINSIQRDKFWKLHKKEIATSPKKKTPIASSDAHVKKQEKEKQKEKEKEKEKVKDKSKPNQGNKLVPRIIPTNTQRGKSKLETREVTLAVKTLRGISKENGNLRTNKKLQKEEDRKPLVRKRLRHHLVSNGRVLGECTTCYSSPNVGTNNRNSTVKQSSRKQTGHNGGRFPSYF